MKTALILATCLLLGASVCMAEDQGNGARPGADGQNGQNGGPGGGRGGPGGFGGMGGRGGAMLQQLLGDVTVNQGMRALGDVSTMFSRMLGINADELKKEVSPEQLPLAASRRFVSKIPVGGIDNFDVASGGWKMEGVFKMSPEQTKSVDALRDEYKAEQKKLGQEIYAEELKLAQKVAELRAKYEQKANDLLTGADKEAKQKMDALSMEIQVKNSDALNEACMLYVIDDLLQNTELQLHLRDKSTAAYRSGAERLAALVPAEGRAALQDMLKRSADEQTQNPFQIQRRMGGRGGPGAGADGGATTPRAAQEERF